MAEAGWYPDPQDSGALQYFDGARWTGDRRASAALPTPPARPRRRRLVLIAGGLALVLVGAGLGAWQLMSGDDKPTLTYDGKQIAAPDQVLQSAESTVGALVTARHGAKNGDTRCYFSRPSKTPSGQKKSDVDDTLLCGPVLFVDGDDSKPYLSVPLTSAAAGGNTSRATLTPATSLDSAQNVAAPDSVKLVRPDGKGAPPGAGGLKVPAPPPADKDVLVTAPLGETSPPSTLTGARMVGRNESVTVSAAGVVERYGSGPAARSAPDGQQLLAFRVTTAAGDVGAPPASGGLAVTVSDGALRPVPVTADPADYVILAVPTSASASLVLTDGGYQQTLSLPSGKPGAGNIAVLARQHRFTVVSKSAPVPVKLSNGSNSANVSFATKISSAALDFWVPRHTDKHPTSTKNALLSVDLSYTDPNNPGTFGWDPQLLKLRLPDGTVLAAKNIAATGNIFNVFEVPADYTTGTLQITGSEKVQGITLAVTKTASFTIAIPAG